MEQNLNERLFDTIITEALRENLIKNYQNLKSETTLHEFTHKFNRKIEKLTNRQNRGSFIKQIKHRGFAIAAACLVVFFIGTNPTVSAYVNQYILKIFPDHDYYIYIGEPEDIDFTLIRADWLPDGYRLSEAYYMDIFATLVYRNESGESLDLTCYIIGSSQISIDNEGIPKQPTAVGVNEGIFYDFPDDNYDVLLWNDERVVYSLQGNIPKEEMVKIGENIRFLE